jgi:hypothetical protein
MARLGESVDLGDVIHRLAALLAHRTLELGVEPEVLDHLLHGRVCDSDAGDCSCNRESCLHALLDGDGVVLPSPRLLKLLTRLGLLRVGHSIS